ncbi:MAG: hypothetical protein IJA73_03570, partial [Oscillospiraceae bacterium]|nr:hypothetical protein [Oscillospiraceae bacterium]
MTIIGLVGPFGSGCSFVARNILRDEFGYHYISLSDILREEYWSTNNMPEGTSVDRRVLQDFGDSVRKENGADYLSLKAAKKIDELSAAGKDSFVVDSIRNPEEVYFLKRKYVNFFVFGIFAEKGLRWARKQETYRGNQMQFDADEKRDKGGDKIAHGQRVTDAFLTSDAIILNESPIVNQNEAYLTLKAKVEKYINLFTGAAIDKSPTEVESIMCVAYSNSLRSSCLKRKVGAVIVDSKGNVFSSGYNEVPFLEKPCLSMYGDCYRSVSKGQIEELFDKRETPEGLKGSVMKK